MTYEVPVRCTAPGRCHVVIKGIEVPLQVSCETNQGSNNCRPSRGVLLVGRDEQIIVRGGTFNDWSISRFGKDSYNPVPTGESLLRPISHWYDVDVTTTYSVVPDPVGTAACIASPPCEPNDPRRTKRVQNHTYTNSYKSGINRWFVAAKKDSGDNNYRSFGYWLEYDMVADSAANWLAKPTNIKYRIFAAGSDPAPVSGLQGTATYNGLAVGIMKWNEDGSQRVSTFEGAPTTLTANFNTMRLNGRVDIDSSAGHSTNYYQRPDGGNGLLKKWLKTGPGSIEFYNALINANGSFTSEWKPTERYTVAEAEAAGDVRFAGHLKEAHPGVFSRFNPSRTRTGGGRATGNCQNRNANPPCNNPWTEAGYNPGNAADQSQSALQGQFYQPDGGNAPGSALGTFRVVSDQGEGDYDVQGSFGTQKQ